MEKKRFDGLIFNPHSIPDRELVDYFNTNDELKRMIGGDEGILTSPHTDVSFRARQIRYVLFLYDQGSPLWRMEPDVQNRKRQAAIESGFDITNQADTVQQMYLLIDIPCTRSIVAFIAFQHNNTLSALISAEQTLHELQEVLMTQMTDFKDDKQKIDHFKTKTALLAEQKKIIVDINEYREQIWHADKQAEDATMDLMFGRRRTPEHIAAIELKKPKILRAN